MTHLEISEDAFHAIFRPIRNHLDPDASFDFGDGFGTLFETFGKELAFVQEQPVDRVWTVIEGDEGMEISSGFHFVNRFGYLVTALPVPPGTTISAGIIPNLDHANERNPAL